MKTQIITKRLICYWNYNLLAFPGAGRALEAGLAEVSRLHPTYRLCIPNKRSGVFKDRHVPTTILIFFLPLLDKGEVRNLFPQCDPPTMMLFFTTGPQQWHHVTLHLEPWAKIHLVHFEMFMPEILPQKVANTSQKQGEPGGSQEIGTKP